MTKSKELSPWVIQGQDSNWIGRFALKNSPLAHVLEELNITNDEQYQQFESELPLDVRLVLGWERSVFLFSKLKIVEVRDYCMVFPPWFNRLDVDMLQLSVRIMNALHSDDIYEFYQIFPKTDIKLLKIPRLGQKSLNDLHTTLKYYLDDYLRTNSGFIVSSLTLKNKYNRNSNCENPKSDPLPYGNSDISVEQTPNWIIAGNSRTWLRDYLMTFPHEAADLEKNSIVDDISYQLYECNLSTEKRLTLALHRYKFLREVKVISEIADYCLWFPPWLNKSRVTVLRLTVRTVNCFSAIGCSIVADLNRYTDAQLLSVPNFGRQTLSDTKNEIENALNQFILGEGIVPLLLTHPDEGSTSTSVVGFSVTPKVDIYESGLTLLDLIRKIIDHQPSEQRRDVLMARIGLHGPSKTLQEVAVAFGQITRERIRQIERKAKNDFLQIYKITKELEARFDDIRKDMIIPLTVETLSLYDDWFKGVEDIPWVIDSILEIFDADSYHVHEYQGQNIIAPGERHLPDLAVKLTRQYAKQNGSARIKKSQIREFVENIVGVRTPELVNLIFTSATESMVFTTELGEERLIALRSTLSAQVINILESSPKPLHVSEIYALAVQRSSSTVVEMTLRNQAALSGYLFAPSTYGLIKHIELIDEQISEVQNVAFEIMFEQPERQWHCHEILDLFLEVRPGFFNLVDSYKVGICLSLSEKFISLGRMIFALAGENYATNSKRIDFFKFVEAVLERSDTPLHRDIILREISLERGLSEYSQILPFGRLISVDVATWALQDKHLKISESDFDFICNEIKTLLLERGSGLSAVELVRSLPERSVAKRYSSNPHILFSVLTKAKIAKKEDIYLYLKEWEDSRRITQRKSVTEAVMRCSRRGLFTIQDVFQSALDLYEHPLPVEAVRRFIVEAGATYDKENNGWKLQDG